MFKKEGNIMNEKKKVWIVLGVVIAIIVFIIGVTIYNNMKSKKELKEFNNICIFNRNFYISRKRWM